MARPTQTVTVSDIQQFVATASDFTFELNVLKRLVDLGLHCQHGGTYDDPITQKTRQFDIQAESDPAGKAATVFRFAFECKNLRSTFPLLMHRVPRGQNESFVDAVYSSKPANFLGPYSFGHRVRLRGVQSPYASGEPVGKAFDQVGKDKSGEVFSDDREVFDKLTQALNSSYELIREAHFAADDDNIQTSVVVPVVVIPDGMLWTVDYDSSGAITVHPQQASHASYFVGKDWFVKEAVSGGTWYTLSHLEVITIGYVETFVKSWLTDGRFEWEKITETHLNDLRDRAKS